MATFERLYKEKIRVELKDKLELSSIMAVPKITKITVNMGVGEAVADKKIMDFAVSDMQKITGQKPLVTKARKSVAGFKIRDGWPIGCKVTLRGKRMYEFLERLITIAIPRIRDFRGYSTRGFDAQGNYNLGIKEQIVFSEIEYDKIDAIRGLDIAITTSAKNNKDAFALLSAFKFPLKDDVGV
ncbi:MAG: 50S ribosomal protein L5 [Gammaproteobacteria bacterium]|nr:50S ribosomal protein L5 [Gammaproteobacteria bacterium]